MSESATDYSNDEFPRLGDSLFASGSGDWRLNAYVRPDLDEGASWYRYIEGYRIAAEAARDHVILDYKERDMVVFPIVFLYRQHFELCLKAIILFGAEMYDQPRSFPGHHKLPDLWAKARPLLERRWGPTSVLDAVETQLAEFARFDPGSFAYRYPVARDGKTCSHPKHNPNAPTKKFEQINIQGFCDAAGRLSEFLGSCAYGLWCEIDLHRQAAAEQMDWAGYPPY